MLDWIGDYGIPGFMVVACISFMIFGMFVMPWYIWWYPILTFGGLAGIFIYTMTWPS